MPVALITIEAFLNKNEKYVDMLNETGFDVVYPKNPIFTRGLCSLEETIDELSCG